MHHTSLHQVRTNAYDDGQNLGSLSLTITVPSPLENLCGWFLEIPRGNLFTDTLGLTGSSPRRVWVVLFRNVLSSYDSTYASATSSVFAVPVECGEIILLSDIVQEVQFGSEKKALDCLELHLKTGTKIVLGWGDQTRCNKTLWCSALLGKNKELLYAM